MSALPWFTRLDEIMAALVVLGLLIVWGYSVIYRRQERSVRDRYKR